MTAPANTNTTPRSEQAAGLAVPVLEAFQVPPYGLGDVSARLTQRIVILEETLNNIRDLAEYQAHYSDAWRRAAAMIDEVLRG